MTTVLINTLALAVAAVLTPVGLVHLLWSVGIVWPCKDEFTLSRLVVGASGIRSMPPRGASLLAGLAIIASAVWPLMWAALIPYPVPQGLVAYGMWALAAVFLLRGVVAYVPFWRNAFAEQPFSRLDQLVYAPLCLAIGLAFAAMIWLARI